MKNNTAFLMMVGLLLAVSCADRMPDDVTRTTYTYIVKDGDSLKLDVYKQVESEAESPAILYSFGGGWEIGRRQDAKKEMIALAREGYVAVALDYRLGVKQAKEEGRMDSTNGRQVYLDAIDMGVDDLIDATCFVIEHSEELGIDTAKIVISGGSAGATNSIMAEYTLCNRLPLLRDRLPEEFNYAAVVPFAGGLWKGGTDEPRWERKPCSFLVFHAEDDPLVPFYGGVDSVKQVELYGPAETLTVSEQGVGLFGPAEYLEAFDSLQVSYLLHRYDSLGAIAHIVAGGTAFPKIHDEMLEYLDKCLRCERFRVRKSEHGGNLFKK